MTDKEKFIEFYKQFEIKLVINEKVNKDMLSSNNLSLNADDDNTKIVGYSYFGTIIEFDENDNFIRQGFWE